MSIGKFFEDVKSGQKEYGESIAAIVNSLLLSIVYFFGVGITVVFAKISGKHFLDLKLDKSRNSYWEELNLKKEKMENYYKQF